MTREEAIEYWQQFDREIDDMLDKIVFDEEHELLIKQREAVEFTLSALSAQQEQENNDPLTIEELRQMDGEPVYLPHGDCWVLVSTANYFPVFVWSDRTNCSAADWYQMCGPAYRRKQEEGTP